MNPATCIELLPRTLADFDLIARNADALELAKEESSLALVGSAPLAQQEAGSTADAIKQDQQSVLMASARLVVKARSGVDNLFDDSGIEQLCRFRKGLMEVQTARFGCNVE